MGGSLLKGGKMAKIPMANLQKKVSVKLAKWPNANRPKKVGKDMGN